MFGPRKLQLHQLSPIERDCVEIGDAAYGVRSIRELSVLDLSMVQMCMERIQELTALSALGQATDKHRTEAEERCRLIVRSVLVAPPDVLSSLDALQATAIANFFLMEATTQMQKVGTVTTDQARTPTPTTTPTGAPLSATSPDSTQAPAPPTGSKKRRSPSSRQP